MDDLRTILFGLHGPGRSFAECREFLDQYQALLDAADPRVLHQAAVYRRVDGRFELVRVDAG